MGNSIIWLWLSCKRQLKKRSFFALLILIPALLWGISAMEKKEDEGICIALYAKDGLEKTVAKRLAELPGAFSFYLSEDEDELKNDVETGKAECGYVFPEDLREKLENNDFRRSIRLYTSPATVLGMMSEEVVFSVLIETYGSEILNGYLKEQDWDQEKIGEFFQKYSSDGSTFSFIYQSADGGSAKENRFSVTFPGRGIGAVFLFITGIFAAAALAEDEKKGLFLCLPEGRKWWYTFLGILAPLFMEGIVVLAALFFTGNHEAGVYGTGKEIGAMALYGMAVAGFSVLLKMILRKPEFLTASVPFFMIGSLALCPVFLDAAHWIPSLEVPARLFLPYHYLTLFAP